MSPDRSHVHHRLIDLGFNQKQTVAILYVISAILGLSAVVLTTSGAGKAIIFFVAVCIVVAISTKLISGHTNGKAGKEQGTDEHNTEE